MTPALTGKSALIVGAAGGIGGAIALGFARAGARLAVTSRSPARLRALMASIEEVGTRPLGIEMDVRQEASVQVGVDAAVDWLGGLNIVVNASGVSPIYERADRISAASWDDIFATNARGAFLVAREAGRHLLEGDGGSIIFLTSIYEAVGGERLAAYAASKGAVRQLARALALDWAQAGIRVNCIAPAYVETELTAGLTASPRHRASIENATPLGRLGTVDDITGAALFLASDQSSYVTGTTLFVDGGWTAR